VMSRTIYLLSISIVLAAALSASAQPGKKPKRARLPKATDFRAGIFFQDAFREGLVGTRPAQLGVVASNSANSGNSATPVQSNSSALKWSEFVSSQTLEDEVKLLQMGLQKSVTTPGRFSGGGYREVRKQFTELATLFAVIQDYDGRVRWKQQAAQARDGFARAAANAKVTSTQAFNDAKQRKMDCEELVRGGTLTSSRPASPENNWENICDRAPLMQKFTGSFDEGLMIWTSNATELEKNLANIKREAELLRLFAKVLTQEGMEDAGDDDYEAYCHQLGDAADAVLQAVIDKDFKAARVATSLVGKSCADCHEDYRG